MDRVKVEKDWKVRGFSCALWIDPPGQVWENYSHETDELLMLIEGNLELEMNGKISHPKVGEEVLIPANSLHAVRNIGSKTNRWLYGYKRKKSKNATA